MLINKNQFYFYNIFRLLFSLNNKKTILKCFFNVYDRISWICIQICRSKRFLCAIFCFMDLALSDFNLTINRFSIFEDIFEDHRGSLL